MEVVSINITACGRFQRPSMIRLFEWMSCVPAGLKVYSQVSHPM